MKSYILITLCLLFTLTSCKKEKEATSTSELLNIEQSYMAIAKIGPKSGSTLNGEAVFIEEKGKVNLTLTIKGATPGLHAAHIHANGDCSSDDGKSAGGHWNPTSDNHGKWGHGEHHAGDIGNIEVDADGRGVITLESDIWTVHGAADKNNVVGQAIIVHALADDFETQPTGAAGGREGCGVIELR